MVYIIRKITQRCRAGFLNGMERLYRYKDMGAGEVLHNRGLRKEKEEDRLGIMHLEYASPVASDCFAFPSAACFSARQ